MVRSKKAAHGRLEKEEELLVWSVLNLFCCIDFCFFSHKHVEEAVNIRNVCHRFSDL